MEIYNLSNPDTWDEIMELKEKVGEQLIPTGLEAWDKVMGGLFKGGISLVVASTGVGKSTFLRSMAKQVAKQVDEEVLYITIEQGIIQVVDYFKPEDNVSVCVMESLTDWPEVMDYVLNNNIHFIMYDYLGLLTDTNSNAEWEGVKNHARQLNDFARNNNINILAAAQARPEILEVANTSTLIGNHSYVAYSKHSVDQATQAVYIIKRPDSNNDPELILMKNRVKKDDYNKRAFFKMDYKSNCFEGGNLWGIEMPNSKN